ncbi:hypothetical protein [Plectonema radiosum]|nr:hypothetical protein [Plectonema radiosum]
MSLRSRSVRDSAHVVKQSQNVGFNRNIQGLLRSTRNDKWGERI